MEAPVDIFVTGPDEARRIAESSNEPHIHDFEELLIGVEGEIEHYIDFRQAVYRAPFISFVTRGKHHRLVPHLQDGRFRVWAITFLSEFIPETTFQLYANYHDHANFGLAPGPCFDRMITLCEMMQGELRHENPDYGIIRHLLSALFTMIEAERRKIAPNPEEQVISPNQTFSEFLRLLEDNFRRPVGVEFYADKLFMSSRNLNLICHTIMQKSVSEIIELRKLTEAKNLLIHSSKNISEIGYELGYNEKTYFTSLFKKKTGQTPTGFRTSMRRLIS